MLVHTKRKNKIPISYFNIFELFSWKEFVLNSKLQRVASLVFFEKKSFFPFNKKKFDICLVDLVIDWTQVPRYIITLHELLAHTPHNHVERKSLENARMKLEELSRVI